MTKKYRVKGKVNSPFILGGLHFAIDSDMDFCINESEIEFIKERVSVSELIDLSEKAVETPKPVLEEQPKTESKPKGVNNERQKSNSASKAKHKENLQLA